MATEEELYEDFRNYFDASSLVANLGTEKFSRIPGQAIPVSANPVTMATAKHTPGEKKPVTRYRGQKVTLAPTTYAGIVEFTKQEWDPDSEELRDRAIRAGAQSIARQLDAEVLEAIAAAGNTIEWDATNPWSSLVEGMRSAQPRLDGFYFDSDLEADFVGATDQNGRPLFVDNPYVEDAEVFRGKLLGRPAVFAEGVEVDGVVGAAGGFRENLFYTVGSDLEIIVSKTATADERSAFDRNLVYVRVEVTAGVVLVVPENVAAYVRGGGGGDEDF